MITTTLGQLSTITLSRPEGRNAFDVAGWRGLAGAAHEVAAAGARVVVIRSSDPNCFSAGSDLKALANGAADPAVRSEILSVMRQAIDSIAALPCPTIAAIEGDCMGAGVALALACDLRLADSHARFAVPPAKLGLIYPREDLARLVTAVGTTQAARLLFTSWTITSREAVLIGLVLEVVDDMTAAISRYGEAILAGDQESHATHKQALRGTIDDGAVSFEDKLAGAAFKARLPARWRTGSGSSSTR